MTKNIFSVSLSFVFVFLFLNGCSSVQTINQVTTGIIDADDPFIQYYGRFDFSNPKKVAFDWPGVYIKARFEGTSCTVRLNDNANEYAVIIDDSEPQLLVKDNMNNFVAAKGLNDLIPHTIKIIKRTEAFLGKGEFDGFILDKGKKLLPPDEIHDRKIEIIGNSITCGYGVESDSSNCHYTPQTENANLSYAAIISRSLNADYSMIAFSGRGVVRNYGDSNKVSVNPMPKLYDRICFNDSTSKWDFAKWIPQIVIINLGTNDFSTSPFPDKEVFQNAYKKLIDRVRNLYPGVKVFCLCGPMIWEPCRSYIKEVIDLDQINKTEKDVFFVEIPRKIMADTDWGCDWHPNRSGMIKIADIVTPVIKSKMNW